MQKGVIAPLLVVGLLIVAAIVGLLVFGAPIGDGFGLLSSRKSDQASEAGSENSVTLKDIEKAQAEASSTPVSSPVPTPIASPIATPSLTTAATQLEYTQPQGKYTLTLPAGWIVESTTATTTYSTTKFAGTSGSISITFGSGKDPLGGCSDSTNISLADRSISACLLLQKDGSQVLTRGYTEDVTGIPFTIEAVFYPDLSINRPSILASILTLNIE